jgi:hypothetical protein
MEKMGLIERKVLPIRIEYYPTKKGERNSFATNYRDDHKAYSRQYYSKDIFKDEKPREFKVF